MTDFSSFSINNVECALITSGWFRRIYPPILLYVNPSRVAMSFSVSVVVPYRRIASAYFSLLCLDIRCPSEVCTIPCRFANSGSCLCRYSLNVSGWSPNSLGGGVFSGFRWLSRIWRLRFSSAFSISANQDPLLPCRKVLPVPSLSRYAICADKNEVLPL